MPLAIHFLKPKRHMATAHLDNFLDLFMQVYYLAKSHSMEQFEDYYWADDFDTFCKVSPP